jgi:hypothetical protein
MPGPGEPLWTQEDRDWARALLDVESESCPDCGQPWAQSSDIANEEAYTADIHLCHACAAGGRAVSAFSKGRENTVGAHVLITKRG